MKKLLFFSLVFASFSLSAQTQLKWNVPATLVLVPHIGMETRISAKWTYQADVAASFWDSFRGDPVKAALFSNELRYYPKEAFSRFYIGPNLTGIDAFKIRKPGHKGYRNHNTYQKGFNILMGATAGYMFHLSENLTLDFTVGGGFGQGFMKHYNGNTGQRIDRPEGAPLNKTGEWWPVYRAGVMLGFKL
ncbi:DUF3575 domain-containing protein [Leadbetterella sp. DM7]|uniref:DUF3575 domain-containing protein n=1 Tax=Leadbetterella sp. DM7 TaxID=3235085 RepID=UPI00349EB7A2